MCVVAICTVSVRILHADGRCHRTGGGNELAPRVIGVFYDLKTAAVGDSDDITLEVVDIIVGRRTHGHSGGFAGGIVGVVDGRSCAGLFHDDFGTVQDIDGFHAIDRFGCAVTIGIISVRDGGGADGGGLHLAAFPGESGAVIIGQRVSPRSAHLLWAGALGSMFYSIVNLYRWIPK